MVDASVTMPWAGRLGGGRSTVGRIDVQSRKVPVTTTDDDER